MYYFKPKYLFLSLFTSLILAENKEFISQFCTKKINHPFNYDLDVKLISADAVTSGYMICFHGSGANNKIADTLKSYNVIQDNLVSFNFPDYNKDKLEDDPKLSTFGTIQELLPALYVIKNLVIDGNLKSINLYGFSAGGGVLVNILTVLSGNRFRQELQDIGITKENKSEILTAIQNGLIILDCPLKSIEEIIAFRGGSNKLLDNLLETYAQRYKENNLRPIDSIKYWHNLNLKILLYFEALDDKLSNRDDDIYANLVKQHNLGSTEIIYGVYGGHCAKHNKLWDIYNEFKFNNKNCYF